MKLGLIAFMCGLALVVSATAEALLIPVGEASWTPDPGSSTGTVSVSWRMLILYDLEMLLESSAGLDGPLDVTITDESGETWQFPFTLPGTNSFQTTMDVTPGTGIPGAGPSYSTSSGWNFNPSLVGTSMSAVPEPSILLLLGSGLIGLVGYSRLNRKKRKASV